MKSTNLRLALFAKVDVLIQRLFVHMRVLGKLLVGLMQLLHEIAHRLGGVRLELLRGQRPQLLDLEGPYQSTH